MKHRRCFLTVLILALSIARNAQAIDASNVLVLYNQASSDGLAIANYYAQVHPGVHLLGISGLSTSEDITSTAYLNTLRPQVLSALTDSTSVIVTTKGMPLRVTVTQPPPTAQWPALPTYTDTSGVNRQILSWKSYSSLESELTAIDRIGSWQMMGDQSYMVNNHFATNLYYHSTSSFDPNTYDMRLTSRLDGYTASDVIGSINRAQNAFIGPSQDSAGGPAGFLIDNDPSKTYATTIPNLVNNVLAPAGLPVTYDNTSAFVGTAPGPVIGYVGHGVNQASTPANYITSGLNITLADGAVFNTWESYNASSFTVGGGHPTQGQIAQWIQKGGTAGVGNVTEPGASAANVFNEDQLFKMLLDGKTFAEAAWSSTQQLSWVNTVVGDPLMTWKQLLPGDSNYDGRVDTLDLERVASNWGTVVPTGGNGWSLGDFNGDGVVNNIDLGLMQNSWGQVSSWAGASGVNGAVNGLTLAAVPEPAGWTLLALGGTFLLAGGTRWRNRRVARETSKSRSL